MGRCLDLFRPCFHWGACALASFCAWSPLQAAVLTVDTTIDSDSAFFRACTAAAADCSLWGALLAANANPDSDTIAFNIPAASDPGCTAATGVCRIRLPSTRLQVTAPVVIDGSTQPGATVNTLSGDGFGVNMALKIELLRALTSTQNGLVFQSSATVRGVAVSVDAFSLQGALFTFLPFTAEQHGVIEGSIFGAFANGTAQAQAAQAKFVQFGECNFPAGAINPTRSLRVGGSMPAQRNWIVAGDPAIGIGACVNPGIPFDGQVQGNLFGTTSSGLAAIGGGVNAWRWITMQLSGDPTLVVGGTLPAQRNVFVNTVATSISATAGSGSTSAPLRIVGNYFGLAADGQTPIVLPDNFNFLVPALLDVQRAQIGGTELSERNLFVANQAQQLIFKPESASVRGNLYWSNRAFKIINREGQTAGLVYHPARPTISAYTANSPTAGSVSLSYRVNSTPAQASYPLTVEFYQAQVGNNPAQLIGRDSYTAAEAGTQKSLTFSIPPGVTLDAESVLIAVASAANDQGTSEFSRYASVLTFIGNGPAVFGQSTTVRVRLQSLGPFRPQGTVTISDDILSNALTRRCTATLQPSLAGPFIAEGECNLDIRGAIGATTTLYAEYDYLYNNFRSENDAQPLANRSIQIVGPQSNDLFRNGFEPIAP